MITVKTVVNAPIKKVWEFWTQPKHITKWNHASDDWHCPKAENNLKTGGKFNYTMASKEGVMSFDFEGTYSNVKEFSSIEYNILGGRKVIINFEETNNGVEITESFEPEDVNSRELQKNGWQAILDNFKKHTEKN
jgi:uncharacterized protein YndB with AHSA1/START domain